jgi:hypothetical protein
LSRGHVFGQVGEVNFLALGGLLDRADGKNYFDHAVFLIGRAITLDTGSSSGAAAGKPRLALAMPLPLGLERAQRADDVELVTPRMICGVGSDGLTGSTGHVV